MTREFLTSDTCSSKFCDRRFVNLEFLVLKEGFKMFQFLLEKDFLFICKIVVFTSFLF